MLLVVLILITVAILAAALTGPFRRPNGSAERPHSRELEEAKLAKYRELRELEIDWRTGKLSDDDYEVTHAGLRHEAAAFLESPNTSSGERGEP